MSANLVRTPERDAAVLALAERILSLRTGSRVSVGIDGVDGAGKTMLADELAIALAGRRDVLRVSIDGFHNPRAVRLARGSGPETFYEDSYDYAAFRASVVQPFRGGEPVTPAVNDVAADRRVEVAPVAVGVDTVLIVDGIFLLRPELEDVWDATVFVDVPFEVSVPRGNARLPGKGVDDPAHESNRRYVQGQRLYFAQADPRERATWVFDNTDLARPRMTT